ncbi:MAG: hypothetical protein ACR2G7_00695 [Acidimicrobiales bacterium]
MANLRLLRRLGLAALAGIVTIVLLAVLGLRAVGPAELLLVIVVVAGAFWVSGRIDHKTAQ